MDSFGPAHYVPPPFNIPRSTPELLSLSVSLDWTTGLDNRTTQNSSQNLWDLCLQSSKLTHIPL